ncbi:MAG: sulfotransferase family 2 domain-containing protein [Gemmatimonadetes bacterium]|nr:sulfotransferase family 2 domain-containing protein [Gemmatimonadota bacterium]
MSLFVHVGYAKAASTFLQERVFARAAGIRYLGKTREDYPDWLLRWHYADDLEFARSRDALRERLDALRDPELPSVLSSEIFTMHGGGAAAQADRLHAVAPDASVIVVVRDPIDRLVSFYRHLVERDGLHRPLEECLEWRRTPHVFYKRKVAYLADSLYDEWIGYYRDRFDGRICVLRHEDLSSAPERFFGTMSAFLGVPMDVAALAAEAAGPRENEGPAPDTVPRRRLENALDTVRPYLADAPRGAEAAAAVLDTVTAAGETLVPPLVSADLRERLVDYYRGRCAGYY